MSRMIRVPVLALASALPLALVAAGPAFAAGCATSGATPLAIGTVAGVEQGKAQTFSFPLGVSEGVIVDLVLLTPRAASSDDEGDESDSNSPKTVKHSMRLCDASGRVLAPMPGEVFEKGGSFSATDEGDRLRYMASAAGTYLLSVDAGDAPREVLVRRRASGVASAPVISATLGQDQKGTASKGQPVIYSFTAPAGQWVLFKSTSEKDTLLRLAGPDRAGAYSVIAENDDSDGLNPVLRRRLPFAGTYYLQVDSLSDEAGEFDLSLQKAAPPAPPSPPAQLRAGSEVAGKLADEDDTDLYSLNVVAGRAYRLEITATYDIAVAVGLPNPLVSDDDDDAGFSEAKSQDSGTSGTEKLNFTARTSGPLLVRIKNFGIGESDGSYRLKAIDLGA